MKKIITFTFMLFLLFCQRSEAWFGHYNPQERSDYILDLLNFNRPLAASNVLDEMFNYCEKKNDEKCFVYAYFTYGQFLNSEYVSSYEWYKKNGYRDKTITFDNINQKSMEYFEKALALAKKHEMDANASAIYIKIGILQFTQFKDQTSACDSFDRSLQYHLMFKKNNPDVKVKLIKGYKSFEEIISHGKKEMGCVK